MGGGSKGKVRESEESIIQAERGARRHNERMLDGYTDLEAAAIADSKRDRSGVLGARGSADLAAVERAGYRQLAANPRGLSTVDFHALGDSINASSTAVRDIATQQAQAFQDGQKLGAVHSGADIAKRADHSLNNLSKNAMSMAFTKAQNEILRSNARFSAALSAAEGAAVGTARRLDKGRQANTNAPSALRQWGQEDL